MKNRKKKRLRKAARIDDSSFVSNLCRPLKSNWFAVTAKTKTHLRNIYER